MGRLNAERMEMLGELFGPFFDCCLNYFVLSIPGGAFECRTNGDVGGVVWSIF